MPSFEHISTSEFLNSAPAAPIIFAETVVDAWKAGSPTKNDHKAIRAFITEELGGWGRSGLLRTPRRLDRGSNRG